MRRWLKYVCPVAIAIVALIFFFFQNQQDCSVCNSFRYHAPCLIDLDEGKILELDLYFPHDTKVAELAPEQPEMGTFSFVRMGNILGTKLTDSKIVEFSVPLSDKTYTPALCKSCRKSLQDGYRGRYVLADLYDMNIKTIIPIIPSSEILEIRCYQISMTLHEESEEIAVTIQGVLDINNQEVTEEKING